MPGPNFKMTATVADQRASYLARYRRAERTAADPESRPVFTAERFFVGV